MTLACGTRLGPYEITAFLGSGGMAEVYRARDVRLGREVAIKILPDDFSSDSESLARFEREARTASALSHPHLVTIYDIGHVEVGRRSLRYIAMELIRGNSLRERMTQESRDTFLRYIAEVADGLAKAHDAGVVHRDLKPENIVISDDGFAKVIDFGLAKRIPNEADPSRMSARLTNDGYCVGTLGYMAPEQTRGERVIDGRADVFALGCILYEGIAKKRAFDGDTPVDAMHAILYDEPPLLPDAAVERIVRRCLAKDRSARYASMRELAADVRNAITRPVRRPIRRRWLYAAAALLLTAGASGTLVTMWDGGSSSIESIAVLPFQNATGNREMQFLTDGLADDVVRDLGRIPALRVIASSSAARLRDVSDPQQAARDLNVHAVLVGRLRMASGMVLLDAELVKGSDGTALWGKKYTRALTDLVTLEQEIARDLCAEVRLELAPRSVRATDVKAYEAYLRGRREVAKETGASLNKAVEHFGEAIDIDPQFALPYAGLAQVYGRQTVIGLVSTRDGTTQATIAARKALSLDPSVPEAHWSLALAAELLGEAQEYERRLARTLQLNPNFAPALGHRAGRLVLDQQYDEAERAYQQARVLDPLSPRTMTSYGFRLILRRRYDRAIEVLRTATEKFPDDVTSYAYLGLAYSHAGRHADALAMWDHHVPVDNNPNLTLWRGLVLARAGRMKEARAQMDRVEAMAKTRYVPLYCQAFLYSELGENDAAMATLDQAVREGDWHLEWLGFDPAFDRVRSDPRFPPLLNRLSGPAAGAPRTAAVG